MFGEADTRALWLAGVPEPCEGGKEEAATRHTEGQAGWDPRLTGDLIYHRNLICNAILALIIYI